MIEQQPKKVNSSPQVYNALRLAILLELTKGPPEGYFERIQSYSRTTNVSDQAIWGAVYQPLIDKIIKLLARPERRADIEAFTTIIVSKEILGEVIRSSKRDPSQIQNSVIAVNILRYLAPFIDAERFTEPEDASKFQLGKFQGEYDLLTQWLKNDDSNQEKLSEPKCPVSHKRYSYRRLQHQLSELERAFGTTPYVPSDQLRGCVYHQKFPHIRSTLTARLHNDLSDKGEIFSELIPVARAAWNTNWLEGNPRIEIDLKGNAELRIDETKDSQDSVRKKLPRLIEGKTFLLTNIREFFFALGKAINRQTELHAGVVDFGKTTQGDLIFQTQGGQQEGFVQLKMIYEQIILCYLKISKKLPHPEVFKRLLSFGEPGVTTLAKTNFYVIKCIDFICAIGTNPFDVKIQMNQEEIEGVEIYLKESCLKGCLELAELYKKMIDHLNRDQAIPDQYRSEIDRILNIIRNGSSSTEEIRKLFADGHEEQIETLHNNPDGLTTYGCTAFLAGVLGPWYKRVMKLFYDWYTYETREIFKNQEGRN